MQSITNFSLEYQGIQGIKISRISWLHLERDSTWMRTSSTVDMLAAKRRTVLDFKLCKGIY